MATAFVNNSDFTSAANDAVTAIRAARKGVVWAALVALAVVVCSAIVAGILIEYGHAPLIVKIAGAIVALGFCGMAAGGFNAALWQLLDLPEYQALQRQRQRLRFFLGALTARCGGGRALLWQTTDSYAAKAWLARTASGAPAGLRVLALDSNELIKYQICRFGGEFIICQTYRFDSTAAATAAFERSIVDGYCATEVFGEDNPSVLADLNKILQKFTSQEVIQVTPPVGGEFPTHTG